MNTVVRMPRVIRPWAGSYVITRANHTAAGTFRHDMIRVALSHRTTSGAQSAFERIRPGRKIDWNWLIRNGYVAFMD